MSKSALYVANTSAQDVTVDGIITPGTIVRRFGPNITLSGNAIQVAGAGYYEFNASITAVPTAAGEVIVTIYKDGVPLQGATATGTAAAAGDCHPHAGFKLPKDLFPIQLFPDFGGDLFRRDACPVIKLPDLHHPRNRDVFDQVCYNIHGIASSYILACRDRPHG